MRHILSALTTAFSLAAAPAIAWNTPPGHCLLGATETAMIIQAATLVAPLEILPERISAPCAAIAEAHVNRQAMLTDVPFVVFGRPAILETIAAPMGQDAIRQWSTHFRPHAEKSLADAWPEASEALLTGWRRAMARGDGGALAAALEARAATTPPASAYAVVLAEGDEEMRFLIEDIQTSLRMGVRVHLDAGRMAWSVIVTPGLPDPHPLASLLALMDAEAAANR